MARELLYREAVREALIHEMRRDPSVFLMGQGIAERGGSFHVTEGLFSEFGAGRVIDTPIAEASVTGMAIGAAIQGKRPVLELAYMDFAMLAMDMIVNQAAKHSFLSGGKTKVPFVIRTAIGTGNGLSMQHSQSLEAFFYHVPGLKIVVPSSPGDAKGLLISAIRDDSPVIFIEHKLLYSVSGEVSEDDTPVPFGKAAIRHNGNDCTIVSYSRMVSVCAEASEELEKEGIGCEALDLRTLVPMDIESVLESVKKTGRLVIVSESPERGSVASDISALVSEKAFKYLKAPVIKICGLNSPTPYSENLEKVMIPDSSAVVSAVKSVMLNK